MMETIQERLATCLTCLAIAEGKGGMCTAHGVVRVDPDTVIEIEREMQRKKELVVRRYVIEAINPVTITEQVPITESNYKRIQSLMEQHGFKSFDPVIEWLAKEAEYRYNPEKAFETRRPMIIIGPPECGKTRFVKAWLPKFEKVFVIDVSKEYDDFDVVNAGDLMGDVWLNKKRFRLFPPDNPIYSDLLMQFTIGTLLEKMKEPNTPLKDFVFVFEDAVRFANNQSVRSFIAESRKFIRKTIVVCQDPKAFEGMGDVIRP